MSPEQLRESLGRWMFERSEEWRSLCSPEDAYWDEWVERNREEWREEADLILDMLAGFQAPPLACWEKQLVTEPFEQFTCSLPTGHDGRCVR